MFLDFCDDHRFRLRLLIPPPIIIVTVVVVKSARQPTIKGSRAFRRRQSRGVSVGVKVGGFVRRHLASDDRVVKETLSVSSSSFVVYVVSKFSSVPGKPPDPPPPEE